MCLTMITFSLSLFGFFVYFHYRYTPKHFIFCILLNMQVFGFFIICLGVDSYLKRWSFQQRHTLENKLFMCGCRPPSFCRQTALLIETAGDPASSTHLIFLDQFVTWWFFLALQAISLPLGHPGLSVKNLEIIHFPSMPSPEGTCKHLHKNFTLLDHAFSFYINIGSVMALT